MVVVGAAVVDSMWGPLKRVPGCHVNVQRPKKRDDKLCMSAVIEINRN